VWTPGLRPLLLGGMQIQCGEARHPVRPLLLGAPPEPLQPDTQRLCTWRVGPGQRDAGGARGERRPLARHPVPCRLHRAGCLAGCRVQGAWCRVQGAGCRAHMARPVQSTNRKLPCSLDLMNSRLTSSLNSCDSFSLVLCTGRAIFFGEVLKIKVKFCQQKHREILPAKKS